MNIEIFVKDIINTAITNAVNINHNKSFYLIKFSSISNKYVSSEVLYTNVLKNYDTTTYYLSDVLDSISKNMLTILPIPILNGKYLRKNYMINKLPSKLIIVFVSMNILTQPQLLQNTDTINYIMNMININLSGQIVSNISTNNTFIDDNKEKYKDEIKILKDMGFTDENKILESLIVSNGNVNNAIHYYLQ